jgi:hypothetical protein
MFGVEGFSTKNGTLVDSLIPTPVHVTFLYIP